jgi:hypothetical protein
MYTGAHDHKHTPAPMTHACVCACCWQAVKVNSLGKWKTALQMTSMSMLLFCKDDTGRVRAQLRGEAAQAAVLFGLHQTQHAHGKAPHCASR